MMPSSMMGVEPSFPYRKVSSCARVARSGTLPKKLSWSLMPLDDCMGNVESSGGLALMYSTSIANASCARDECPSASSAMMLPNLGCAFGGKLDFCRSRERVCLPGPIAIVTAFSMNAE